MVVDVIRLTRMFGPKSGGTETTLDGIRENVSRQDNRS